VKNEYNNSYKESKYKIFMIACVDSQRDFDIYFEHQEILDLDGKPLEGKLVRVHKPKQQGLMRVSLNDSMKNHNGYGIGIEDKWPWKNSEGEVDIFIGNHFYDILLKEGIVGTRYGHMGSKIHLYNRSFLSFMEEMNVEHLEFYVENRDRLHSSLG